MKKSLFLFYCILFFDLAAYTQVGIGTNAPNPKAALDIRATDKGVLFPGLTTAQRDAITDPPNGLHIYNTDEECLNYYNSLFQVWVGYCDVVKKVVTIKISADATAVDFYNAYAKNYPGTKNFIIIVQPGVTLTSGAITIPGVGMTPIPALYFLGMPTGSSVKIVNHGNIVGAPGAGGNGPTAGTNCTFNATNGTAGGDAIGATTGISITVDNYGIIAGGGGGGGGGGRSDLTQYGGGGGGAAPLGVGGTGGGTATYTCIFISCGCILTQVAQSGNNGLLLTGGSGGAGASNGGSGGNGGDLGMAGQNGTGTGAGLGGSPGIAVRSFTTGTPTGIIINNLNGGQVIGTAQ